MSDGTLAFYIILFIVSLVVTVEVLIKFFDLCRYVRDISSNLQELKNIASVLESLKKDVHKNAVTLEMIKRELNENKNS